MPTGLRAIAAESRDRKLKSALERAADELEAGGSTSEALGGLAASLPPRLAALLRAGVRSGKLAEAAGEAVLGESPSETIRRRVKVGLIYPAILLVVWFVAMIVLCATAGGLWFVFEDFGLDLPSFSYAVIRIAMALGEAGMWAVLGPLAALGLAWTAFLLFYSPAGRTEVAQKTPFLGPIWRLTAWAEFCRVLATLIEIEVALPEAVSIAGEASKVADFRRAAPEVCASLESGADLGVSLRAVGGEGSRLGGFLRWGEARGTLAEALPVAAEILEARARARADQLVVLASLFTILFAVWWAAVVIVALVGPLMNVMWSLSG